jgi:hypothetical protein
MEDNVKKLLDEEIVNRFDDLSPMDINSEEYTKAVDSLAKLYKLRLEDEKNKCELEEKRKRRIMDNGDFKLKEIQANEEKLNRYIKLGIEVAGIILPLMFYTAWMNKGFEFEKEGTFTSMTFKGLFNRFKPTK